MIEQVGTIVHEFEAGKYFIGDPCYFISDDNWDDVIKRTGCFGLHTENGQEDWFEGLYHHNGKECFAWGTLWGDGSYDVLDISNGRNPVRLHSLGVDAGLLGIMPVEAVDVTPKFVGGKLQWNFYESFEVMCTRDHVFYFGNLKIIT